MILDRAFRGDALSKGGTKQGMDSQGDQPNGFLHGQPELEGKPFAALARSRSHFASIWLERAMTSRLGQ